MEENFSEEEFPNLWGADFQLTIDRLIKYAARLHPKGEIVYRDSWRGTYEDIYNRCQKLSNGLEELGVQQGDKIAIFDWNTHRQFEAKFAIPSMGLIAHEGNPLLTPEQVKYVINDAEDDIIMLNEDFIGLIEGIEDGLEGIEHYVILTRDGEVPDTKLEPVITYRELLKSGSSNYEYPRLDERTPAMLTYTTGTTGKPKGCWYSHRRKVLHALIGAVQIGYII